MATEAQRLIGISLTKIAQSRAHRGGVSLHKNLLVATVLQKARYIFMEEAYHMVHTGSYCPSPSPHVPQTQVQHQQQQHHHHLHHQQQQSQDYETFGDESLVALTPEEAGIGSSSLSAEDNSLQEFLQPGCGRCSHEDLPKDKENVPPPSYPGTGSELTYLDLDRSNNVLRERSSQSAEPSPCLKRRRAVTEWETEEAVLSILPKRTKCESEEEIDDNVFLDEAALFSECVAREVAADRSQDDSSNSSGSSSSAMEIDRITSLVSIFSFGNLSMSGSTNTSNSSSSSTASVSGSATADGLGKLARSVSTPDLCSAQAKESVDALQQRPFLAMTV